MKTLKTVLKPSLLLLVIAAPAVLADTEFGESVPREVVEQFIGSPLNGESKLYSDILAGFPTFVVPQGFEVLGSADQVYSQRVILKTSMDAAAANTALMAAFTAEAWQEVPVYGRDMPQTGFISGEPAPRLAQLCKDGIGNLTLMVSAGSAPRYVHLTSNVRGRQINGMQQSCADQIAMATQGPAGMRARMGVELSQYAPRLELPMASNPAMPMQRISDSFSGSSNDWETRGALAIDWTVDQVFSHFATQIAAQGWSTDAAVTTGARIATGSWTKSINGLDLVGLLTIVEVADDNWDMKFRIVNKGSVGAPAAVNSTRIGTVLQ